MNITTNYGVQIIYIESDILQYGEATHDYISKGFLWIHYQKMVHTK